MELLPQPVKIKINLIEIVARISRNYARIVIHHNCAVFLHS